MPKFKITNAEGDVSLELRRNLTQAEVLQEVVDENPSYWAGVTIEEIADDYVPPTSSERVRMDIDFGNQLISFFLEENRDSPNVTTAQGVQLLMKFDQTSKLLQYGDLKTARALLAGIATDAVFPEERKQRYITQITDYLAQYE